MILCTNRETNLPAYIWVNEIEQIESHEGSSPWSRVFLKNRKESHEYFLDVLEDKKKISEKIKNERLTPGKETRENESL